MSRDPLQINVPDEVDEPRRPASIEGPLPVTALGEFFENLDRHSSPSAWAIGCRIQYVHDKNARDLDWWFRNVWRANGCCLRLSEIKQIAAEEKWSARRGELWDRVYFVVEERFAEEQAEQAISVIRQLRAVQALMFDQLTPDIVIEEQEDGRQVERLKPKVKPKSFEGMVRALKDVTELIDSQITSGLELITGERGSDAVLGAAGTPSDEEGGESNTALSRLRTLNRLRNVANRMALSDGKVDRTD